MEEIGGDGETQMSPLTKWKNDFSRAFQYYLDRSAPHMGYRWLGTLSAGAIYVLRVYYARGFYIISYGIGIYVLNLLIGFLSPKVDPEIEALDGTPLPTKDSNEFRPFIRRLPEFKFCLACHSFALLADEAVIYPSILLYFRYAITKAFCVAFFMTFFSAFDVPVFWPILFFYWVFLFFLTTKRLITHMIKHRYVPFNIGKQRYASTKSDGSTSSSSKD